MNNLKKYREKAKLKPVELAKKVGVSNEYIYKIEKDDPNIGIRTAYKIAKAVKKSVLTIWPKD
jgi:DNA-binding XRE family transcriptional regulator